MTLNSAWIYDSYYDRPTWCIPFVYTVRVYAFLEAHRAEGFVISGVYGGYDHWNRPYAGGHTNRSTHDLWGVLPAITHKDNVYRRYVPAIDYKLPAGWMDDYERWYVAALRANRFPYIQYININYHHYHRETGYAQQPSGDGHCHDHPAPGFEIKVVPLPLEVFYHEVMHPQEEDDMSAGMRLPMPTGFPAYPDGTKRWSPTLAYLMHYAAWNAAWGRHEQRLQGLVIDKIAAAVANLDAADDVAKAEILAGVAAARAELARVIDEVNENEALIRAHMQEPADPS